MIGFNQHFLYVLKRESHFFKNLDLHFFRYLDEVIWKHFNTFPHHFTEGDDKLAVFGIQDDTRVVDADDATDHIAYLNDIAFSESFAGVRSAEKVRHHIARSQAVAECESGNTTTQNDI